jgi:hypothetical protein
MAKDRTSARRSCNAGDMNVPALTPDLPTGKAFVVQLSRETGPALSPFAGRVEHLSTGRRARFETLEEFLAAVTRLLSEARQR